MSERFERLRFLLAGVAATLFAWLCRRGLERLSLHWGIPVWVDFDRPMEVWWPNGNGIGSTLEVFTGGFTPAGILLPTLSLVLSYYVARAVYHLSLRRVFDRRSLWVIAGWFGYVPWMVLLFQLAPERMVRAMPGLHAVDLGWFGEWVYGIVAAGLFLVSTNLFVSAWQRLMRWRKVPAAA
jgi:hypothetical protein